MLGLSEIERQKVRHLQAQADLLQAQAKAAGMTPEPKPQPDMNAVLMAVIDSHTKQIVSLMNFLDARDQLLMKFHGIGYARLVKEAGIMRGMELDLPPEPGVPTGASMPESTGGLPGAMPEGEIDPNEIDESSMKLRFPIETETGPKLSDF